MACRVTDGRSAKNGSRSVSPAEAWGNLTDGAIEIGLLVAVEACPCVRDKTPKRI
jgi:hypothetical protein